MDDRLTRLERVLREDGPFEEKELVEANMRIALEISRGFRSRAAHWIGISKETLRQRMKKSPRLLAYLSQVRQQRRASSPD